MLSLGYNGRVIGNWIGLVVGVWLIVSPWILGASGLSLVLWNNVLIGLALFLRNLWRIFGKSTEENQ
jgi:hypothetical protein